MIMTCSISDISSESLKTSQLQSTKVFVAVLSGVVPQIHISSGSTFLKTLFEKVLA